ncbi:hypothetical protein [Vannielia litorea]|uniref:Uncharacterized protein n=1 Tax=Vannielia litorea TaxID=1217970 RepID=A0A1N6IK39_9RHOB|nr:hypothetical protein [Vannielia litorea]SIO32361.1 hypothetical protein SAMN05444002_3991 [Vannielia litorea]
MIRVAALSAMLAACSPVSSGEPVLAFAAGADVVLATAGDIESVAIMESFPPGLSIGISPDLSERLGGLTAAHVGEEVVLSICDEEVARPRIAEPIQGRNVVISQVAPEKAEGFAAVLGGEASCPG